MTTTEQELLKEELAQTEREERQSFFDEIELILSEVEDCQLALAQAMRDLCIIQQHLIFAHGTANPDSNLLSQLRRAGSPALEVLNLVQVGLRDSAESFEEDEQLINGHTKAIWKKDRLKWNKIAEQIEATFEHTQLPTRGNEEE